MKIVLCTFPWPDRSSSIRPFSVPISKLTPHNAAHKISELKRFLYFLISGVSLVISWDVGVTLTLTWLSRRDGPEPPAPNPNVRKLRCFCCNAYACGGKICCVEDDRLLLIHFNWLTVDDGDAFRLFKCAVILFKNELFAKCFGDDDNWLDNIVEFGDAELSINDLEGVEWTELIAARYYIWKEKRKKRKNKTKRKNRKIKRLFRHWIQFY